MAINPRRAAIKQFITVWNKHESEKSDAHLFWLDLLTALGLENPTHSIEFERPVDVDGHKCFVDVWIPSTRVLIEHKSKGIDLEKPARQSDELFLTAFEQAKRYADALPYSQRPRWIVTCNFDEFRVHDMDRLPSRIENNRTIVPQVIKYKHLAQEYKRLMFLVDPNDENIAEVKISKDAVDIVKRIRKAFAKKMLAPRKFKSSDDPVDHLSLEQRNVLNKFCIRLVFCLYAEDAALFNPNQFIDYLLHASDYNRALGDLFRVLNTPKELRAEDLDAELLAFEYVDGELFNDDALELPPFDKNVSDGITLNARRIDDEPVTKFNWFAINPTIFGALFESDLNPITRREGGMHYTARENILKVIKPLFLDELHDEFDSIKRKQKKNRLPALKAFQEKLASLTFLDPACGSGNFLTETYIQLRTLENDVMQELLKLNAVCEIKVTIDQFYGIEINDFACAIAELAMWISESKMYFDTDVGIRERTDVLPLKHSAHITCGNALELDWHEIVPNGVDYILGNPPFSGARFMSAANKADLFHVFDGWKNAGNLDFVACWFKKAADFMIGNETRAALVSTNSIVQGESVGILWSKLFETIHIDFAHRTFKWTTDDEAINKAAAVHCVIVGFSNAPNNRKKFIIDGDQKIFASNINGYLLDADNFYVESRAKPLCSVPPIGLGNMPIDDGNFIIKADHYDFFTLMEPDAEKFIRRYVGAEEFINNKPRYCLWLVDATADDLKLPLIAERVEAVRRVRLSSKSESTRALAATPHLFAQVVQPVDKDYIIVPRVTSERRKYIPMGFLPSDVIASDATLIVPDGELFHFGVLESSVHMAWTRTVCGRLEMRYRYSATIVYNNFPWCARSPRIEQTAQAILDARAKYPSRSLASLYDEETMPSELRAAHEENDRAVLDAYGFDRESSEAEIVSRLMKMYEALTKRD